MSTLPIGDRPARRPVAGSALAGRRSRSRSVRRALAVAGCGVLTVTLAGCESTEQESAKIGREEQQAARALTTAKPASAAHSAHGSGGQPHHAGKHQSGHSTGSGG
jgi:hypothetical protein